MKELIEEIEQLWLDDALEIRKTANQDFDIDYKIEVMDSPIELKNKIFELKK